MIDLKKGQKVAFYASLITISLVIIKIIVGKIAGSTALLADAVHSGADVLVIFAAWLGLFLARKKDSKKFPYGLYKAETFAAFAVSGFIIYAAVMLFMEGLRNLNKTPEIDVPFLAMGTAIFSAFISIILSVWEKKVGVEINSQSLIANSDESKMDFFSSFLVFFAVLGSYFEVLYIESILTLCLSLLIFWVGIKNGYISLLGLLDVSPDVKLEKDVRKLVISMPEVKDIEDIKLRQAGPVLFGESRLKLSKSIDINRGHEISHKVRRKVKSEFPQIEAFNIHIEPYQEKNYVIMIPIKNKNGMNSSISRHFGKADYFAFVKIENNRFELEYIKENPFKEKKVRASLAVVEKFVKNKSPDILITKEIGQIGFHTIRDYFVDIYMAEGENIKDIVDNFIQEKLKKLEKPTHKSDDKIIEQNLKEGK